MKLSKDQQKKLDKILSKVGDLNFKRRILTMLEYLDINPNDHILDIGCGEGFYALIFDKVYGCKVTAIDYDEEILTMAKDWLSDSKNIKFEIGNICDLKYADNTFDKIVCSEVLEHIDDHITATKELYRVLKPDGILGVTVPNHNYPFVWDPLNKFREKIGFGHFNPLNGFFGGIWAYDHKRLYYPEELQKLLVDHNFVVKDLKVLTHYGVPFNHLVLYVGKQFYMKMPVSENIKDSMEKFKWDESPLEDGKKSISQHILNTGLRFLTWVDSFNNKDFDLETSTMVVAAKATKR